MEKIARSRDPSSRPVNGRLPSFVGGGLPVAESAGRKVLIRVVALLAIAVGLAYLLWRALFTVDLSVWWVSVTFLGLEAHALLSLALFTFSLWDINALAPAPSVSRTSARIAVLIPTYNESCEVLLPTVAAAVGLSPDHETWVLDDGDRREVEELARELGALYLARPDHKHAKAGNINHALGVVDADLIAILDADHVARPDFLTKTLGYFDDPNVALVQTPQDFYNLGSFEHEQTKPESEPSHHKPVFHEEALFYRVIQSGKNRWGAAFWCGTGAVVRVAALRDVGGVATGTITEDIHTTVRLHRRGWKTVYHNEVLARGLAARTFTEYQLQRVRWGTGAMQLLRQENPLVVSGLRFTQRIAYASTLLGWFEPWRTLGYVLLPIVVLLTGAVPVQAHPAVFLLAFGLTLTCHQVAVRLLSRGYHRMILSVVFDLARMAPSLLATLRLLHASPPSFKVTPKGRHGGKRHRSTAPTLLLAMAALAAVSIVWFCLTVAGRTPLRYEVLWAACGAVFWVAVNMVLILAAIFRIRSQRFGAERRSSVRFRAVLSGVLDGVSCTIDDVSLTGASVSLPVSHVDDEVHVLTIDLGGTSVEFRVGVSSRRLLNPGWAVYGLHFLEGQAAQRARLALALLNAQTVGWPIARTVGAARGRRAQRSRVQTAATARSR